MARKKLAPTEPRTAPTEPLDDAFHVPDASARGFVDSYFGPVDFGHAARDRAFQRVAEQICRHPGGALPDKMGGKAAYYSMDRLMNRPEVTHAAVLAPHRQRTFEKMAACTGPVLILHDTTVLDYSGKKSLGLPPVGNGHGNGYLCHNALAVDPARHEILGLAEQILHRPARVPRREGVQAKRERSSRESRLWSSAVEALPAAPAGRLWIDVADRGADLFEFLATEIRLKRVCLVRSAHNRCVRLGHDGQGALTKLHTHLRSLPAMGQTRTKKIFDGGLGKERTATLRVSWAALEVMPPHVKRGEYQKKPIAAWGLRVWEESPPEGSAKLEWFLVSLVALEHEASAWLACDWYCCRWMVEELHKAKKTGCGIENLQFHTPEALEPMIALLSVTAVMLLNLREAARRPDAKERAATEVVEPIYEEVLRGHHYRRQPGKGPLSVHEFMRALAMLGGHMGRKGDGFPGWLTTWRGWQKLQSMVAGAEIERRRAKPFV